MTKHRADAIQALGNQEVPRHTAPTRTAITSWTLDEVFTASFVTLDCREKEAGGAHWSAARGSIR